MNVNKSENVSYFDVDDTLVLHQDPDTIHPSERVSVRDPVHPSQVIIMRIHRPMVRLLKEASQRGDFVRVWSRGGWQWAKNVVEALELTRYVNSVESKPMAYFDDSPIEKWLPYRVYIQPDTIYKTNKQPTKGE